MCLRHEKICHSIPAFKYVYHKYCESYESSVIYTANSERYRWQTIDDKLKRISPHFYLFVQFHVSTIWHLHATHSTDLWRV
jgi:hypothetical protein